MWFKREFTIRSCKGTGRVDRVSKTEEAIRRLLLLKRKQFGDCCCSVTKPCLTLWSHGLQQARLLCPPLSPGVCSNSRPLSRCCYLTMSSSAAPYSFCLQSFPASGSFPMSQFFTLGDQSIRASASASVFPMNIQDWFPLGLTGLISLQSQGFPRAFSNTTVQKHQFFSAQLSL